ncbi:MAG: hypothetical protein II985_07250 [Alistipes sp.]|nr:hypothetical protein [Alistipes sp.]
MKNFLLVITILFTAVIVNANGNTMQTDVNENATVKSESLDPIYWQGWAEEDVLSNGNRLYITVYRTQNQCDAFYAIATKFYHGYKITTQNINVELVVREDSRKIGRKYYVSYDGRKYYFAM